MEISPRNPFPGTVIKVSANAKDPDGDSLLYKFTIGDKSKEPSASPSLAFEAYEIGLISVTVLVSDSDGAVSTATNEIEVFPRPPSVEATVSSSEGSRKDFFIVEPRGECPETSSRVDIFEVSGASTVKKEKSGEFKVSFSSLGKNTLNIRAISQTGATSTISKEIVITNMPPHSTIVPLDNSEIFRGKLVDFKMEYEDEDGSTPPSTITWNAGSGEIVKSHKESATVKFLDLGSSEVSVTVEDADGGVHTSKTSVEVKNNPPKLKVSLAPGPYYRNVPVGLIAEISDVDSMDQPPRVEVSPIDSTCQWSAEGKTLTFLELGHHVIRVAGIDANGARVEIEAEATVVNSPPQVSLIVPEEDLKSGENIKLHAEAVDLESENLTYQFEVNGVVFPPSSNSRLDLRLSKQGKNEISVDVTDTDGSVVTRRKQVTLK